MLTEGDVLLDIQNLHVHFFTPQGVVKALNGINLPVHRGRILGVMGESGAGKTVTALSVLRLLPHPGRIVDGQIIFEGQNLLSMEEPKLRQIRGRDISLISQDPMAALNPALSIATQVAETMRAHLALSPREVHQRCIELLSWVGLSNPERLLSSYPFQLSGGMAQRVMIAIALALDPKLLIADEPTSALDVTIQAQVLAFLRRLQREADLTLIFITHDLGVIAGFAEEVAVLYGGTVVERSAIQTLFRHPTHPYTYALLQSLPRVDRERRALRNIPGAPPSQIDPPEQCPFLPRCNKALTRCRVEPRPPLEEVSPGHWVACYNPVVHLD